MIEPGERRKKDSSWLYLTHNVALADELIIALNKALEDKSEEVWLMQEPFIIHICCKTIEDAQKLLEIAQLIGLKRAGIKSLRKNIVELYGTEKIETLVIDKGVKIVDDNYISIIVKKANERLLKTREMINKLEIEVKKVK